MQRLIYPIVLFTILFSCDAPNNRIINEDVPRPQKFEQQFLQLEKLLANDKGDFWGQPLYGPMLLVDTDSLLFYANENDDENQFRAIGSIFKGNLPKGMTIANTAINWGDKRWTMLMLPLPKDEYARNKLLVHELFHRIQPTIGFDELPELSNSHLDTYQGRLLLKLELQALEKALYAKGKKTQFKHIENALFFRSQRQKNEEIKKAENSLELNEGLAEYTGVMLSGGSKKEIKDHFIQRKITFFSNPTFVRSFAYETIPVYGYLLSFKRPNWQKEVNKETNLTDFFIETFAVEIDSMQSFEELAKANPYNYQKIVEEEADREKLRLEKIAKLKSKFVDQPTLELKFQNMNISFDPRNITPLENYGTVYPNLQVTDDWGILTVKNGALLDINWSKLNVSIPNAKEYGLIKGDGWTLELNTDWEVNKKGSHYFLEKK